MPPCSAETRFQGIATWPGEDDQAIGKPGPCSAETRFQGIATNHYLFSPIAGGAPPCSAETRFQGIATWPPFLSLLLSLLDLQC